MTDRLSPQSETWRRGAIPEPASAAETVAWWRAVADQDEADDPSRAAEYRLLADRLEAFIALRGRA